MSQDHQLKFGVVGGKTGVNSCCPFEQTSWKVILAARSLQGALLNYNVFRGFLSILHINPLSPSSGRLNLFQVNWFTPSSGCQCSIQLKQIITRKIKTNAPSEQWDTNVQASWYLSFHASKFHQSDSRETKGHVPHYWHSPSTLQRGKKACMHTHKHRKHWFLSELHTAGWMKTRVNLQH